MAARGEYTAHGSTWRYVAIDRYTRRWSIGSPHGIVGQVESIERLLWFSDARGAKLAMHDRIYALQRDGSYEHVPCCEGVYVSDSSILQVGSTLVLALTQKREQVTDCIVHPPGLPDYQHGDPERTYQWISFFGEFDPQERKFYVREFRADVGDAEEIRRRNHGTDWEEKLNAYYYSIRKPLACGAS